MSRVLRVFFDWGHRWPLWENGSDEYAMDPTDYGYSPALIEVLRQWQQAWMPIADFDMGETDQQPSNEAYQRTRTSPVPASPASWPRHPRKSPSAWRRTTSRDPMSFLDLPRALRADLPDLLLEAEPTPTEDRVLIRGKTGLLDCARRSRLTITRFALPASEKHVSSRWRWAAGLLASVVFLLLAWVGGDVVFGKGSASEQCSHADSSQAIGWDPREHIDDPIEAWYPTRTEFTVFPSGLTCTYRNANTGQTGTSRYITWGATLATGGLAPVVLICAVGTMRPRRSSSRFPGRIPNRF